MITLKNSTHSPGFLQSEGGEYYYRWGDYITLSPKYGSDLSWDAAGFVLEGGNLDENVVPYYFVINSFPVR
jgi:hypothetical protein